MASTEYLFAYGRVARIYDDAGADSSFCFVRPINGRDEERDVKCFFDRCKVVEAPKEGHDRPYITNRPQRRRPLEGDLVVLVAFPNMKGKGYKAQRWGFVD
ncbi:hypothetical protein KGQ55_00560 [Patescibacteria group bacterium]|nr:hypothetical protein [Patescibacteria group bacterium]